MSNRTFTLLNVLLGFAFSTTQLSWNNVSANVTGDLLHIDSHIATAMLRNNISGLA
jgi:hypothetical protein